MPTDHQPWHQPPLSQQPVLRRWTSTRPEEISQDREVDLDVDDIVEEAHILRFDGVDVAAARLSVKEAKQ